MRRGYLDTSLMKMKHEQYKNNKRNVKTETASTGAKLTQRQEQSPTKHSKNMAA